ncbi:hypothetical protein BRADI_3g17056v3 [Brachypodium distachyon]|uniref:Reverse transcriptase zinc-binding domain-containing protein n=1 Tax=Brachypodium distachyon TaxID=15368 RepID=A0A2K2CXP7_BRADI|nr:hypothetical protein BRADI_3g17056v3 [Brachypodium distachyon]
MWQDIVTTKYLQGLSIASVTVRIGDSTCWKDLMKVKQLYLSGRYCEIGSGERYFIWVKRFLPGLKTTFVEGLGAVCWAIWKTRNAVCFEKKVVHHPTSVVFILCSFLRYWAELQKNPALRQGMTDGAAGLLHATIQLRWRHQATRQAAEEPRLLMGA